MNLAKQGSGSEEFDSMEELIGIVRNLATRGIIPEMENRKTKGLIKRVDVESS